MDAALQRAGASVHAARARRHGNAHLNVSEAGPRRALARCLLLQRRPVRPPQRAQEAAHAAEGAGL